MDFCKQDTTCGLASQRRPDFAFLCLYTGDDTHKTFREISECVPGCLMNDVFRTNVIPGMAKESSNKLPFAQCTSAIELKHHARTEREEHLPWPVAFNYFEEISISASTNTCSKTDYEGSLDIYGIPNNSLSIAIGRWLQEIIVVKRFQPLHRGLSFFWRMLGLGSSEGCLVWVLVLCHRMPEGCAPWGFYLYLSSIFINFTWIFNLLCILLFSLYLVVLKLAIARLPPFPC